ncbi:MAG: UDP-glucose/GDP-mannose dehydrogenase family protein [Phycisphaeraceae bacterium]|nr:UDP-glucose/GDP-mannose dehydrogenase family protein [Phycisphaeraceae bacterium]
MKIGIFGMGYVGVVTGACLVRDGHSVVGVDPVAEKVHDLNRGNTPIQEPHVAEMLAKGHQDGLLTASTNVRDGLDGADLVLICVGTPSQADGGIDLVHVERCAREIGATLKTLDPRPLIVLRSTVLPGTTRQIIIPLLEEASGLRVGRDLDVVFHPEFLREGKAVEDFDHPPKIVVGEARPGAGDRLMALYPSGYEAPRFRMTPEEAELVKYCDNLFHAVKITFANEVGALARSVGVDSRKVADVFCSDRKLNISPAYLRPGFAFGGSCLPKDLRAITRLGAIKSIRMPMLGGIMESNAAQIDDLVARILARRPRKVGMLGLAFKPGTDDMRESPYVKVAKMLIGEGIELKCHDPHIQPGRLIGANKRLVSQALGHLESLLVAGLDDLDDCDLIVINHPRVDAPRVLQWLDSGRAVLDLVGIEGIQTRHPGYEGIHW